MLEDLGLTSAIACYLDGVCATQRYCDDRRGRGFWQVAARCGASYVPGCAGVPDKRPTLHEGGHGMPGNQGSRKEIPADLRGTRRPT